MGHGFGLLGTTGRIADAQKPMQAVVRRQSVDEIELLEAGDLGFRVQGWVLGNRFRSRVCGDATLGTYHRHGVVSQEGPYKDLSIDKRSGSMVVSPERSSAT